MQTASYKTPVLQLFDRPESRLYTAEICNMVTQGAKKSYTAVALEFGLSFLGLDGSQLRRYKMEVDKRFFLNERYNVIKKLGKAQGIGLKLATINNNLEFAVDKHFKFLKIANPQIIRETWKSVKADIVQEFPDLKVMAEKFDDQLKGESIQELYREDNFFNFLFADIFHQKIEQEKPIQVKKMVSDAVHNINIPILQTREFTTVEDKKELHTIILKGEMDTESDAFPLEQLSNYLGQLNASPGSQHALSLIYSGVYRVRSDIGLVTSGSLNYDFVIGDVYKKTTIINFNLESHG